MQRTVLFETHQKSGARMVEFAGWEMPLNYGSQIEEHHVVRKAVGLFDVSHMMVTDIQGLDAQPFLRKLLANDVIKLNIPGRALYSCMLNDEGGVIDDLIIYFFDNNSYRIVSNAGTREKVSQWLHKSANDFNVQIMSKNDLSIIAIQGPESRGILCDVLDLIAGRLLKLSSFHSFQWEHFFIACTGYTGEDGFEIILPSQYSIGFWEQLIEAGAKPVGLGARDSLRLEAGMNLYGTDMDEEITPLESGLAWTVAWEPDSREFTGRSALESQRKAGVEKKQMGLILKGKGIFRTHQQIFIDNKLVGEISSGGFSPVLGKGIALARVDALAKGDMEVQIRNKRLPVEIVKPPFI